MCYDKSYSFYVFICTSSITQDEPFYELLQKKMIEESKQSIVRFSNNFTQNFRIKHKIQKLLLLFSRCLSFSIAFLIKLHFLVIRRLMQLQLNQLGDGLGLEEFFLKFFWLKIHPARQFFGETDLQEYDSNSLQ